MVGCVIPAIILSALILNLNWNVVESSQLMKKWKPNIGKRLQDVMTARGLEPERLQKLNGDQTARMRIVPEGIPQDRCVLLEEVQSSCSWRSIIYVTAEIGQDGVVKDIHAHTVRAMF
jgi:hypothetical protein